MIVLPTIQGALSSELIRRDLIKPLTNLACGSDLSRDIFSYWQEGIYDAHLELQAVEGKEVRFSLQSLRRASQVLAGRHQHLGSVSGLCSSGRGWVATVPSPRPYLLIREDQSIEFKMDDILIRSCAQIRIDHSAAQGGKPRKIKIFHPVEIKDRVATINTKFLSDGLLAFTCSPKFDTSLGPQPWFFVPTGLGPSAEVPFESLLKNSQVNTRDLFLNWVNQIRFQEELSPLEPFSERLREIMKPLFQNKSVNHRPKLLRKVKKNLKLEQGQLIGENLVKGESPRIMAWMLWNSPRHRKLLLSAKASHLGIHWSQVKQGHLMVMVFVKVIFL